MAEQCAIGPDGELLPASRISFIYDPDDPVPMPAKDTVDPEQCCMPFLFAHVSSN